MSRDQKLIDGLTKHAAVVPTVYVNGQPITGPQAITTLQARMNTGNAVAPAKAAHEQAVEADLDERAQTKAFVTGLRQALLLVFAGQPQILADLGIAPRKAPAPRSTAEKQAAVTRAVLTAQMRRAPAPAMGRGPDSLLRLTETAVDRLRSARHPCLPPRCGTRRGGWPGDPHPCRSTGWAS